ncbi:uncharacterized protein [Antedon mediterranea]|uniref:uncharacterized protein n=1 Tax=Antedon mediterranea TaxID=105859 RepID=UPI003AF6282C
MRSTGNLFMRLTGKKCATNMDPLDDNDKIAIVGIGCRYGDGVEGPREMWSMLKEMRDCTTSHPAERFDKSSFFFPGEKKKGKLYTKRGGYLKQDPFMFDRQFFRMSPSEAEHMDPQIRILLEVVWESIEDAGIPASTLRGSNTGVYMGVTANEYFTLTQFPFSNLSQYSNSGTNSCMISNRISYEFDLRGPSFSIDTACSSSLYAVQVACDALRRGSCDTAIAGGVNIILTPTVTIGFCQAGMLSPEGQSKSFDASADGYSRSEGVGSVFLKPLKKAIADNDRIYAVIRGGALTNDGRTPGIANPSYDAQIDLVHKACAAAKVDPCDITYIEAHGTGTKVGDKTEANAIGESMGKQRSDDLPPLYIGSIKSNVGHAEGAAGIAGVIKTALSLYHREIPGVVHFKHGNPNIQFHDLKLRVPSTNIHWPDGSKLLAGCSSFGFGGANAHIVFQAAPQNQQPVHQNEHSSQTLIESYKLLMISANSQEALHQRCIDWKNFLLNSTGLDSLRNMLYTANVRIYIHEERAALIAKSRDGFVDLLQKKIDGESLDDLIEGKVSEGKSTNGTVFVFSGMGTQWWGMARELINTQPIFKTVIERIDGYLGTAGGKWSLIEMLTIETDKNKINSDTEISQVCICSIQIGLVELYKHYGVRPSAVIGHSVGEVAAAYAAGLITMKNSVKIIFNRGHILRKTSGSGTMVAVLHDVDVVKSKLESTQTILDIAAINSPAQIVLSGKTGLINDFSSHLKKEGIVVKLLNVNNAFHSYHQEGLKKEFVSKISFLQKKTSSTNQTAVIPMMSTVTNRYVTLQEANDPGYWWSNIRQKVRFRDAVDAILNDGYSDFIEIGAHPALSPSIKEIISSKSTKLMVHFITHSLKRPRDISDSANDNLNFITSLAHMFVRGYSVDMTPCFQEITCQVLSLPLYPWQRIMCSAVTTSRIETMRYPNTFHPLLGKPDNSANFTKSSGLQVWKGTVGIVEEPWIADHVVQGSVVFPAAGFIETSIAAHHELFTDSPHVIIKDMHFDRFMFVSDNSATVETTTKMETGADTASFIFCSFNKTDNKWIQHTSMKLLKNEERSGNSIVSSKQMYLPVNEIRNRCSEELNGKSSFYSFIKQLGFDLGDSFMSIENIKLNKVADEAIFYLRAPDTVAAQSSRFYIHPAFLDGILQGMMGLERLYNAKLNPHMKSGGRVPRSIEKLQLKNCKFPDEIFLHINLINGDKGVYANVSVADAETQEIIARCSNLRFGPVGSSNSTDDNALKIWEKKWVPIDIGMEISDTTDLILITGDDKKLSLQLKETFASVGLLSDTYNETDIQTVKINMDTTPLSHVIITIGRHNEDNPNELCREQFLEYHFKTAEMCISQYKALSTKNDINPKIWFITRDGVCAKQDDIVDPYQTYASVYGFGISVIQENMNFVPTIIDIPSDVNNKTTARWLLKYIRRSDTDETFIALRHHKSSSKPTDEFKTYAYRLRISDIYDFPYKKSSKQWKLDIRQSIQTGRLLLKKYLPTNDETKPTEFSAVTIEAFMLLLGDSEDSNGVAHPVVMFCGHSGQSTVIGVCSSNDLQSTVQVSAKDLIALNTNLPSTKVINIVSSYLLPFIIVRDLKPSGTTIVCMESIDDTHCLAVAHMAIELGHTVLVVVTRFPEEYTSNSDTLLRFVHSRDAMTALNTQHVGCVIGRKSHVTELLRSNKGVRQKLTPFATIGILKTNEDDSTGCLGLSKNTRIVVYSYELPLIGKFHQVEHILKTMLALFEKSSTLSSRQKVSLKIKHLKDVKTYDLFLFQDVIFSTGINEAVPLIWDFSGSETKFSMSNSYIVTGGTTGFGLSLVEWLVDNGAGHIFILSRSVPDSIAEKLLDNLRSRGIQIVHIKTDISQRSDVEHAFESVLNISPNSLSGVFHCAAQYDDRLIENITQESWSRVMATKSWGALLLHQTSIKFMVKLEYFVLVSSVVQLVGNAGQASYCAANTYLSSLGHYRRKQGLPATVLCPGVIGDTGFAARELLIDFWERKGIESLPAKQVLHFLDVMLNCSIFEMGVTGNLRIDDVITKYRGILKQHDNTDGSFMLVGFSSERYLGTIEDSGNLINQSPDEAEAYILQKLCSFISKRIGLTTDISPNTSPSSLGVDSLTATELSDDIQKTFHVPLPSMELINVNATVQTLSVLIYKRIVEQNMDIEKDKNEHVNVNEM